MPRPSQCVILVGGRGSRLGSLTEDIPKPMMDIGGKPFLEYLLQELARQGFCNIVLLLGYRADRIIEAFSAQHRLSCGLQVQITWIVEPEPAGTAGALLHASHVLETEFLLLNGDSLFDINLRNFARMPPGDHWLARIALREVADTGRYGAVELNGNVVSKFSEKKTSTGPGLINGGVYWLKREILDQIAVQPCSLERDILPTLVARGNVCGVVYRGFFLDIGIPEDLASAQHTIPRHLSRGAAFLDRDGVINVDHGYVHRPSQFEWIDGAKDAIRMLNDRGFFAFIVTNQAGVARGLYSKAAVDELHAWINDELSYSGAYIDDFRYCPHHPSEGQGPYLRDCDWRKPAPGMLLDLMRSWPVCLSRSFLVGDKKSDLEAAERAGISGYQFRGHNLYDFIERIENRGPEARLASDF